MDLVAAGQALLAQMVRRSAKDTTLQYAQNQRKGEILDFFREMNIIFN
jgi:hypothetical protein